jgi:hypothetical protein
VPTSVAVGPDGYYYVGELKGFPAPQNESRIWRIAPWASWAECGVDPDCELVFDGGFTSIIDMAFGPEGLLYVVELDENSWFAANLPPQAQALAGGTINACDVDAPACVEVSTGMPCRQRSPSQNQRSGPRNSGRCRAQRQSSRCRKRIPKEARGGSRLL